MAKNTEKFNPKVEEVIYETNFENKRGSGHFYHTVMAQLKEKNNSNNKSDPESNFDKIKTKVSMKSGSGLLKREFYYKLNDENLNTQNNITTTDLNHQFVGEDPTPNVLHLSEENTISALIKYCLRKAIHLPFYDFNFVEGMFTSKCKIEEKGTEYVGYGRSSTLKVAKMIASQEVIEELKSKKLYFDDNQNESLGEGTDYKSSFDLNQRLENQLREESKIITNRKSIKRQTNRQNTETIPIVNNFEHKTDSSKTVDAIQRLRESEEILRRIQEDLQIKEEKEIIKKNDSKDNRVSQISQRKNDIDNQLEQIESMLSMLAIKTQREALQNAISIMEVLKLLGETVNAIKQTQQ